jgi:hypothetical protein
MISYLKTYLSLSLLCSCVAMGNMAPGGFKPFVHTYFIETGTFGGDAIRQALAAGFKKVRSLEINKIAVKDAREKFKNNPDVHIIEGESGSILYDTIKDINEEVTFWLDAHNGVYNAFGENTPLLRELEQIKMHHIKTHTILIDDMHCAGKELFDFITKEMIIAKIKEINPDYEISYVTGGDDAEVPNNVMVAQVRTNR